MDQDEPGYCAHLRDLWIFPEAGVEPDPDAIPAALLFGHFSAALATSSRMT